MRQMSCGANGQTWLPDNDEDKEHESEERDGVWVSERKRELLWVIRLSYRQTHASATSSFILALSRPTGAEQEGMRALSHVQ